MNELPQSVVAEQAVVGGLMLSPDSWAKIADWITEEDFLRHDHKLIFRAIRELALAGKPYDAVTLGEWFDANCLTSQIDPSYLVNLQMNTHSAANIVAYAEIVQEKSRLRQLIAIGQDAMNAGFTPKGCDSQLLISETQRKLNRLVVEGTHVGPRAPKAELLAWYEGLRQRYEADNAMTGLESPWHDLNKLTFGWQPGELIIVAARPNVGKSILGFSQLAFSGLRGHRCVGFSLEMTYDAVLQRMVSAHGTIPHDWLRSPASDRDADHWAGLTLAVRDLQAATFTIDDQPRLTAEQIAARALREHMRDPLKLVIIDHLHDMRRPGKDLVNEIADDCRVLKALGKQIKAPIIVMAQLNRQGNDRPVLKDLRASGGIEEVADVVLLMHREDYQKFDDREPSPVEIIVAKGRNMPTGKTIYLKNRYDVQRLDDFVDYIPPKVEEAKTTRGYVGGKDRAAGTYQ